MNWGQFRRWIRQIVRGTGHDMDSCKIVVTDGIFRVLVLEANYDARRRQIVLTLPAPPGDPDA